MFDSKKTYKIKVTTPKTMVHYIEFLRYKFPDISVRKELKPVKNSLGEKWVHGWIRTRSYYYK